MTEHSVWCYRCKTEVDIRASGVTALRQHSGTKKCIDVSTSTSNTKPINQNLETIVGREFKRAEILIAAQLAKEDFSLSKSQTFVNNSGIFFVTAK